MNCLSWTQNAEQREIVRLLNIVAGLTNGDVYLGKRGTARYRLPVPFEATLDPSNRSEVFIVTLHNLCEKGIAFQSRRPFSSWENVYIRQFSSRRPNNWIGIRVTHCTRSLRGFIIGAKLHCPIDESDWASARDDSANSIDAETVVDSTPRYQDVWARQGFMQPSR